MSSHEIKNEDYDFVEWIICGLGNPGIEYDFTRHNMGFMVLNHFAAKNDIKINLFKFKGLCGEGIINDKRVLLLKPQTYMNFSGDSIREALEWNKLDLDRLILIYDDISLPIGKLRIRAKGSDGGHKGVKSVIEQLNSNVFPRIKLGVNAPPNSDYKVTDWVLNNFFEDEVKTIENTIERASSAIVDIIMRGCVKAASTFNG